MKTISVFGLLSVRGDYVPEAKLNIIRRMFLKCITLRNPCVCVGGTRCLGILLAYVSLMVMFNVILPLII